MPESVTIHRDEWGIPHVYANTDEAAAYGLGWAQAEDRLTQLLRNYRLAAGTMAEAFGQEWIEHDWQQRLVGHEEVSRRRYHEIPADARAMIEAFQAGVRDYMAAHPGEVPPWAPELEPWQVPALGRFIIFGWPMGTAMSELNRRDQVDLPFSSNMWAVRPERSAEGCAIFCIDPHIPWDEAFRFYEFRAHGDRYHVSGFGPLGSPFLGLGHNACLAWSCTTGGPDTTDIYAEEVNPANPLQYRYDGEWRDMQAREITIRVKDAAPVTRTLHISHHGPILLREGHRAYALATPYLDEVGFTTQFFRMCMARDLDELKAALTMNQLMEQNFMAADLEGNIVYVRTGRVPIRPQGYDFSKPVPGHTSKSEWLGLHSMDDFVQIENPACGYMQNCNNAPNTMMRDCPIRPHDYPSYIYNSEPGHHTSRSRRALELLDKEDCLTLDRAMAIAVDARFGDAPVWRQWLAAAARAFAHEQWVKALEPSLNLLAQWRGDQDADSIGPALFWTLREFGKAHEPRIDQRAVMAARELSRDEQLALLKSLRDAQAFMMQRWGRLDVPWGDVHRIRRGDRSWPAPGGDHTLRAIGSCFEDGFFYGRSGQSWTQVVLLRNTGIESYSATPFGQSDHPDSPHYTDQAEKLFSKGKLKPTWFQREALEGHIVSTLEFDWTR